MQMDRTTRLLLAIIAVALAAIALKPLLHVTSAAVAQEVIGSGTTGIQDQAGTADQTRILGYRVTQVSTIVVPKGDTVRSLQVLDKAQSFVVQYDNRLEVYRINDVRMTPGVTRSSSNSSSSTR